VLNKVCGWPQVPRETLKHLSAFLARPGYRTALAQREIEVKAKPVTSRSMDGKPFVDIGLFCGTDGMVDGKITQCVYLHLFGLSLTESCYTNATLSFLRILLLSPLLLQQ